MIDSESMYASRWPEDEDQHVILHGMSWQDYEAFLAIRGERSGVRMYYLDGAIELMSPTKDHGGRKTTIARLLETWALLTGVELTGYGSWTLKKEIEEAGAEPDECYIVGRSTNRAVPDLAIEIEWSRVTGLSKHEIYARLGVRELWTLVKDGKLVVRVLERSKYVTRKSSKVLPELDLEWLLSFAKKPQAAGVRALHDALVKRK